MPRSKVAWFDLRTPPCIGLRPLPCPALSPGRRRVEANQPAAIVVNRGMLLVELHVEPEKESVVAKAPLLILQPTVEIASVHVAVSAPGHPREKERLLPTAPRHHLIRLGHYRLTGGSFPMAADLVHRAFERLDKDYIWILLDASVARILGGDACVPLGDNRDRQRLNRRRGSLTTRQRLAGAPRLLTKGHAHHHEPEHHPNNLCQSHREPSPNCPTERNPNSAAPAVCDDLSRPKRDRQTRCE
ncbi:hypothetical protein ACFL5Z_09110 [Planctomycetota bacterium]